MTITSGIIERKRIHEISASRKLGMGIAEILIALVIFLVFVRNTTNDLVTRFVMTPGYRTGRHGQSEFTSRLTLLIMAAIVLVIGLFQLIKGFESKPT